MQVYRYKGYDPAGNPTIGEMVANSADEVERKLLNQQIAPVSIETGKRRSGGSPAASSEGGPKRSGRRISDAEAAKILASLASMVNAGVTLVEALDAVMATATRETVLKGLRDLKNQVVEGRSLAEALRAAKTLFPPVVADLVRVAEEGGSLSTSLAGAGAILARSADLRRKVKNAMLYPVVMLSISFLTVLVLVVFVMPKFADVFQSMNADVPVTTKLLIDTGIAIRGNPIGFVLLFAGSIIGLRIAFRNERVSALGALLIARMPGIGDLINKLALSRSLQAISALVSVNVPLVQALDHGSKVAGNRSLTSAIQRSMKAIQEGETLFKAFSQHKVFPPAVTQMIGVGERTGNLGTMLSTCAIEMEGEADARLKALVSVLEPLLIVVMGLIVGTITVSIILPIYGAVQNLR